MISLMNSTDLAAMIGVVGYTLIHFVNLSTSTKICVNPPLASLNRPTRSSPDVEKGQVLGMVSVDETTRVSSERKTGNLHTNKLRNQGRTRQWAKRTPTCMSSPQAIMHLHDCHKSLHG
jgi:hypothetical protein